MRKSEKVLSNLFGVVGIVPFFYSAFSPYQTPELLFLVLLGWVVWAVHFWSFAISKTEDWFDRFGFGFIWVLYYVVCWLGFGYYFDLWLIQRGSGQVISEWTPYFIPVMAVMIGLNAIDVIIPPRKRENKKQIIRAT